MEHPLARLVQDYQPSSEAIELVRRARIALLVGITGAGKDTILNELLKQSSYHNLVSHTTRQPRVNRGVPEVDGVTYHFASNETVAGMLERQQFIEAKLIHGIQVSGTSMQEIAKAISEGKTAVTDLDINGVEEYRRLTGDGENIQAVFLVPPDMETWLRRLRQRYESEDKFEKEWPMRLASAANELETALGEDFYVFVVNHDLHETTQLVHAILCGEGEGYDDTQARRIGRQVLEGLLVS